MNALRLTLLALFGVVSAWGQTATLTANNEALSPTGGSVVFTATTTYDGEPGALGWSIELPADWTLESVTGPHMPAIAPEPGATGTLEFAFTSVPNARAEFTVIVRYPAGTSSATAAATVLLRDSGKLTTLKPTAVQMRVPEAGGGRPAEKSRNN